MKLNKMTKEELEQLSYQELAKEILEEEGKNLNTPAIFKTICDLLGMSDEDYTNKIGDFYTSLTTDKNFVSLGDGTWDLRDRHSIKVDLDEEEDEDDELAETEEELDDELDDMAPEELDDMNDVNDDLGDMDDEEEDLRVIEEDELEE